MDEPADLVGVIEQLQAVTAAGRLDSVAIGFATTTRTYEYDGNASGGNGNSTLERDGTGAVLAGASHGVLTHTASYWSR